MVINWWIFNGKYRYSIIEIKICFSIKKRIQSFHADDALKKWKYSFDHYYNNKYCQILISNLISAQVVDQKLNWNELGQRIIVFGLKSYFAQSFNEKNYDENILKIPTIIKV